MNPNPNTVQAIIDLFLHPSAGKDDEEVDWAQDKAYNEQGANPQEAVGDEIDVLAKAKGAVRHSLLDWLARGESGNSEKTVKESHDCLQLIGCRNSPCDRALNFDSTTVEIMALNRPDVKQNCGNLSHS